ncbi:MAG: hypothetical protein C0436_01665 [Alphaproteobacteria bacterium]|nr:hypothetical protein [Alphaproteobacteria bacterium]
MPGVITGGSIRAIDDLSVGLRHMLVSDALQYLRMEQSHGAQKTDYSLQGFNRARETFYSTLHQAVTAAMPGPSLAPSFEGGCADYYESRISTHRHDTRGSAAICTASELTADAMKRARESMRGGPMRM